MNQLLSVTQNNYYKRSVDKEGKETFKKFIEIVFLTDEAGFIYSNEGEIVRQRKINRTPIIFSEEALDMLIERLKQAKEVDENTDG
jgi:hypothetical protein